MLAYLAMGVGLVLAWAWRSLVCEGPSPGRPAMPPWGFLGRVSTGNADVVQYDVKVMAPADATEEGLLALGREVVKREQALGLRHVVRILCFAGRNADNPDDAFAEIIWAPGGELSRAREALGGKSYRNEYRVVFRRANP